MKKISTLFVAFTTLSSFAVQADCVLKDFSVVSKTLTAQNGAIAYELVSPAGQLEVMEILSERREQINTMLDIALINKLKVTLSVKDSAYSKAVCQDFSTAQASIDKGNAYSSNNSGSIPSSDIGKISIFPVLR
jgi:hypothetical protein